MKWVIGLPVVTAGLIAIDKHASGALPRNPSSASADISDVGLFATAVAVGVLLIDGTTRGDPHARETGVLGAEAMANSGVVYAVLQLIAERERPLQGTGQGNFFQTSGLDNSFPSGHTIITWTAASIIAHEYAKPWVEWLTYGRHRRLCYAIHQPAALPVRCCGGQHSWILDRTPYLSMLTASLVSVRFAARDDPRKQLFAF